ncbi:MAG: hypothetical protein IKV87_02325 [Methanobrevibacter sp.]|nr:hypothetical protein [Methanobrevibacter sp.]
MNENQNDEKDMQVQKENMSRLKEAIENRSIENMFPLNGEWGGAYVIVTSDEKKVFNPETDEDNWYGHRGQCTYVLTQHAKILSDIFYYVRDNIMNGRDIFLYGFMALLANDYIRQFDDPEDPYGLLDYVANGVEAYYQFINWEIWEVDSKELFKFMRSYLSLEITDNEIRHIF